jgi:hypothetical protein
MDDLCLQHLISGFDEDMPADSAMAAVVTAITGYTEWVTMTTPAITLGWDWQLDTASTLQLIRVSEPRCNVMLLDSARNDLGYAKTCALLEVYIDRMDWQSPVQKHLQINCID